MVTILIIIITGLISYKAFEDRALFHKLLFNPYLIFRRNEWYRVITHGFIHADWTHLLVNMFVFYSFGQALEMYFRIYTGVSNIYSLITYFGGMIFACTYSLFKHKNNAHYNAVGASGAVSAITFACILFAPMEKIYLFAIIPIPGIIFGLLYLGYTYYMSKQNTDNIAHDAHFLGAIFGLIFPIIVSPSLVKNFINQIFPS